MLMPPSPLLALRSDRLFRALREALLAVNPHQGGPVFLTLRTGAPLGAWAVRGTRCRPETIRDFADAVAGAVTVSLEITENALADFAPVFEATARDGVLLSLCVRGEAVREGASLLAGHPSLVSVSVPVEWPHARRYDVARGAGAFSAFLAGIENLAGTVPASALSLLAPVLPGNFALVDEFVTRLDAVPVRRLQFWPFDEIVAADRRRLLDAVAPEDLARRLKAVLNLRPHGFAELTFGPDTEAQEAPALSDLRSALRRLEVRAEAVLARLAVTVDANGEVFASHGHSPVFGRLSKGLDAVLNGDTATAFRRGLNRSSRAMTPVLSDPRVLL